MLESTIMEVKVCNHCGRTGLGLKSLVNWWCHICDRQLTYGIKRWKGITW
jgi:ribosomal protein L37AE/L43A